MLTKTQKNSLPDEQGVSFDIPEKFTAMFTEAL